MVIDNKIDDVRTILLQRSTDIGSPQLHTEDVITRCHEHCRCRKCRRIMAATSLSNGHVPSSSTVVASGVVDGHILLQSCSEVDKTVAETVPHDLPTADGTEGQVPSTLQSLSPPNGQVPSTPQSVSTSVETENHDSSSSCLSNSDDVPVPANKTSAEAIDLICRPSTDTKAQSPSLSICGTVPDRPRCHPLCSCDQCSQLIGLDDAVEMGPDVFCRNERGYSGESFLLIHFLVFYSIGVHPVRVHWFEPSQNFGLWFSASK